MKIAIDVSPLKTGNFLSHRVRGTGFYLTNLLENLKKNYPDNEYLEFIRGENTPSSDLLHIPYFEPFFITLPRGINKKTVVTVHDMTPFVFPDNFPAGLKGKIKWKVQRTRLKKAGAVITDSQSSKKDISKFTGIESDKIHVVYLAASEHFKPQGGTDKKSVIKKYKLPEEFGLYVGDATWNKNLPTIISTFKQIGKPLVIVGKAFKNTDYDHDNPWTKDLAKAQDLAKESDLVHSLGFVPDLDLVSLYSAARVLVMPSFYEGFGLPLVEAMRSGCPVVTSDRGSIREVGGDCVYYVDPYNLDSVKNGILKIWNDDKLRTTLSEKGLLRAQEFTWNNTAKETMNIYEKIANK